MSRLHKDDNLSIDKEKNLSSDPHATLPTLARTGALASSPVPSAQEEEYTSRDTDSQTSVVIPQKYRWIAFSMIIFFATGSGFSEGTLGPLKSTLIKQLKINSEYRYLCVVGREDAEGVDAQYGAIASADNLINTILPIVGGIGIDHWGAT